MDKFNVINLTANLSDLENDMCDWLRLPYEYRMRSDDDCIRLYGVTNTQLYNKLKALILSNELPEDPELIGNCISEGFVFQDDSEDKIQYDFVRGNEEDFDNKMETSKNLQTSPYIIIIDPFKGKEKEYEMEDLVYKYSKFSCLGYRNKRISNIYSRDLWGYDVPSMYNIMKNIILGYEDDELNLLNNVSECAKVDSFLSLTKESVEDKVYNDDKLGLYVSKLDSCANMDNYSKTVYNDIDHIIDSGLNGYEFDQIIPQVVPYFTPDEMEYICPHNVIPDLDTNNYYTVLNSKMKEYNNSDGEDKIRLEKEILSMGWNPSVELSPRNLDFARNRQLNWLKENAINIVDISNMKVPSNYITEASSSMKNLYKEKGLYPIYIVLSFSNTVFGNIIKAIKHCTYSHAGLALDSNLKEIFTFKFGKNLEGKENKTFFNGFSTESLETYIKKGGDKAIISVMVLFVDKSTLDKMNLVLKDFVKNQGKSKYGFGNLFNILLNKPKNDPESLSLVCSQFVDTVLKLCNINLNEKPSNLVTPQDFIKICNNPTVYKVYESYTNKYNESRVEGLIRTILTSYDINQVKYKDMMKNMYESFSIESFYCMTENEKANTILEEARYLLTPKAVIYEKKLPFKFNDKGDLSIELSKNLEDQYQESHKLLTGYNENNLAGIKSELARLFFINSTIEKKIKKMKKNDTTYKSLIDLRARVLNDFKKYIRVVLKSEPDFDFAEYFKGTDYYNGNIVIDNSTLKYSGNLIKKFIKAQGV